MSNLADLLPAGGGQNNTDFVADGTISSGAPVVLTAAGKAAPISATSVPEAVGTTAMYGPDTSKWFPSTAFDSTNNRTVFVYKNQVTPFYVRCVIGTTNGTGAMTYGTEVVLNSTTNSYAPKVVFDSNAGKAVVFYYEGSSLIARVGTVDPSDNSISFGSPVTVAAVSGSAAYLAACFDTTNNQILVIFPDNVDSSSKGRVVTVNGTSLTLGSEAGIGGASDGWYAVTYDSGSNSIVFAFQDYSNSYYGSAMVGQISSSTPSFPGSVIVFDNSNVGDVDCSYDSTANRTVFVWRDNGSSSAGKAKVGTVDISAYSITFGSEGTFNSTRSNNICCVYDSNANKTVIAFQDQNYPIANQHYGRLTVSTVDPSDNSITFSDLVTFITGSGAFDDGGAVYISLAFDSTSNIVVINYIQYNSTRGYGIPFQNASIATNLTSTNLLGIASGAISDTATGTINTWGSRNEVQTGLTIGSDYYVQANGTITAGSSTVAYDISSPTYTQAFSVSSQDTAPTGLAFNTDGTKMFVVGDSANAIHEYALSTGFDISTASFTQSFSTASQSTNPSGIAFKPDGTIMYVSEAYNSSILQYALSSAFDVSSASYTHNFSVAAQEADVRGVAFNTDGTVMLITGIGGDDVNEYALSSAYDVSSASFTDLFSISSQDANPQDLLFNSDGTTMWIVGDGNDSIFQYTLSSGFDVSTASYASVSFSVASQDTSPMGMAFNSDGTKLYVVGQQNDSVYQYEATASAFSTDNLIGKAITATQINIKDYTG